MIPKAMSRPAAVTLFVGVLTIKELSFYSCFARGSPFHRDEMGTDSLALQEVFACKGIGKNQIERIKEENFAVHHFQHGDK
jgi:hypothetical protein